MIKKVRWKFIAITMGALALLLFIIVLATNSINYYYVTKEADETLDYLAANGGVFPLPLARPDDNNNDSSAVSLYFDNGAPYYAYVGSAHSESVTSSDGSNSTSNENETPGGKEGPYATRYFTVTFDKDGNITKTNADFIRAFTKQEAEQIAQSILTESRERGYVQNVYRYLRTTQSDQSTLVIVLDYTQKLSPLMNFLKVSLLVIACGIVVAFGIVYILSGLVVNSLIESDKKQKQFITEAGHEMKTPLTIISANNEIIEMEYGESDSTKTIAKEVNRMNEMVRNLTSLAKIDEMTKPVFSSLSLTENVSGALSTFSPLFKRENKKLESNVEDNIVIRADESMIRKLLSILLDNARKYSLTETHVSLTKNGLKAQLEISNDAEGVKNGNLSEVFNRFYRSDKARSSSIEGSGIGLAIAKQISEKNHFKISAYGTAGKYFHIVCVFSTSLSSDSQTVDNES